MSAARLYSERLGAIGDAQFEAVAERFALGRFVKAEPVTSGLFGQNVFLTTTGGEFVLRGAPHWVKGPGESEWRREDRWQFTKEVYFSEQLHARTKAPVPWPMRHDTASDIFGWPYIVMPRMPGTCFGERDILTALAAEDRRGVAAALGETLAEMQRLTSPFAGDFGTRSIALEPDAGGAAGVAVGETRRIAAQCDRLNGEDRAWIEAAIAGMTEPPQITYVHCDYKLNNLTVLKEGGRWRVAGLFDFHEARFADGTLDIVRQACSYLDTEPELARVFIEAYGRSVDAGRLALHAVNDRLKIWDYFSKPEANADWLSGKTFRGWAQAYVDGLLALL